MRAERGSALVIVVMALFLAVMIGGVAVSNTVSALTVTTEEQRVKRAQQAADAAIDAAIYALNRLDLLGSLNIDPLDPSTVLDQNCLVSGSGGDALDLVPLPPGDNWCPEVTGETENKSTWSYRVSQLTRVGNGECGHDALLSLDRRIVAVGTAGGVTRRIAARLRSPVSLFSGAAVQSGAAGTAMTMADTARVTGNVHANFHITGTGGTPVITGNATVGAGATLSGIIPGGVAGEACQNFLLPPVAQGDAATVNHNGTQSWADTCVDWALNLLPLTCDLPLLPATGGIDYDASRRTLKVWGNGALRLTGRTYSFCKVELTGQALLIVPPGSEDTRIFIDAPENCSGVTGAGQFTSDGLSRVVNCHVQTDPGSLQLYAVGSETVATTQTFAGAGALSGTLMNTLCGVNIPLVGTPMIVYAPESKVVMAGSAAIAGQVAADVVAMSGASSVTSVNALVNLNALGSNPVLPLYKPQEYVSCISRTFAEVASDPAHGC